MKDFIQHFTQYINVSDELECQLISRGSYKLFTKGEIIHHASEICVKSYFIKKGLVRLYYVKNDKEISEYFCSENEWVNSPRSFMFRESDVYFIDALENTETFELKVEDLGYLFDNFPEMERYARLSMNSLLYQIIERMTSMRFSTAKEKYDHFRRTYHKIHPRIPLGMTASYLGITQETLSRIRSQR
jgi:CRP-like cAMP-binding protein